MRQMRRRVGHLLGASEAAVDRSQTGARGDDEPALTALDVKSVLKVAQAIASEIELEGLLRTLLTIAIENAGAARGVFLQVRDDEVVPVLEASAENDRVGGPTRRGSGRRPSRLRTALCDTSDAHDRTW